LIYQTGLTNNDIHNLMKSKGIRTNVSIYADSAEPKTIKELLVTSDQLSSSISQALSQSTVANFGDNLKDAVFNNVRNGLINAFMQKQNYEELAQNISDAIESGGELTAEELAQIQLDFSQIENEGVAFLEVLEKLGLGLDGLETTTKDVTKGLGSLDSEVRTASIRRTVAQGTIDFSGVGFAGSAFSNTKTQLINVNVGDVVDREKLITDVKNAVGQATAESQSRLYGTTGGVASV
jgi:hypothetical protein